MEHEDFASRPAPSPLSGLPDAPIQGERESLGQLVSGVVSDLQELVRAEINLAKTELREDASAAGKAIGVMVAGGVVGLVGFIFLMLAATWALALALPLWASALIVAVVLIVVAAILALWGKNELSAAQLGPEKTIESLKEDQEWAKRQINSVKR